MKDSTLMRIVRPIIILVVFSVAYVGGLKLINKYIKLDGPTHQELSDELGEIRTESRKNDPEKKAEISQKLLDMEYRVYYRDKEEDRNNLHLFIWAIAGVIEIGMLLYLVRLCLGPKRSAGKIIGQLLLCAVILGGAYGLTKLPIRKLPPKPEEVTCRAITSEVKRKDIRHHHDSDDGADHSGDWTEHMIFLVGVNGEEVKFNVTEDEYNKTKEHDTRYIAVAEAGDEVFYMNYYNPDSYRLPADK